ncbi:MAG: cobalamin biosynthesis protein CbiM [Candidatus Omnitrophota bacterium]|jgi:cobalt/nickel transport system permease protein|nr:MAG: cobalamin biosynthesis protein CbiM [Candidatus Omnitrophota bacterium]
MHLPDGFLSTPVWIACDILAVGALIAATRQSQKRFEEKTVPLTGIMCAFIFAAQMINFPVAGGTSGHLLGGLLAAVFLGPWLGCLVISLVLIVQCFLFQDGGVAVLGANILNMAVIGTGVGYLVFQLSSRIFSGKTGYLASVAIGSWISVNAAAIACALQLGFSGTYPTLLTIKAMVLVHTLIGIGEAVITVFVVSTVMALRSDLIATYTTESNS